MRPSRWTVSSMRGTTGTLGCHRPRRTQCAAAMSVAMKMRADTSDGCDAMRRARGASWDGYAPVVAAGDMCGDERAVERASPDGRLVARSFVRNCGATTAYVGLVEVRP